MCEVYNKGEIKDCILVKNFGYEVDCKVMCCYEDGCNMEDIFVNKIGNNLGIVFVFSVMILLFGLLLIFVNIN